jgi:hypothetical protein
VRSTTLFRSTISLKRFIHQVECNLLKNAHDQASIRWFRGDDTYLCRGVQIRSESDRIRSDFGTKIFISDWPDKGQSCFVVGSDYSFDSSIGRHFVSFLTYISCFYIYLVK